MISPSYITEYLGMLALTLNHNGIVSSEMLAVR